VVTFFLHFWTGNLITKASQRTMSKSVSKPSLTTERIVPNETVITRARPCSGAGTIISPCGKYTVFRENYRIYVICDDQKHDITPKAWSVVGRSTSDVYISDWAFTPDSTVLVYIDQNALHMYFVLLEDLSYIDTYRFESLAGYDAMTIKTPVSNGVLIWEIAHLILVDNQHAVVITHPSRFLVHNFKNRTTRYYQCDHINDAVFLELDATGSQLSFVSNKDRGLKYTLSL
jgi:hypothetical protein